MAQKEYCYYWFHHMSIPFKEREQISKIIEDHDYKAFIEKYKKWNSYGILHGCFDDSHEFSEGTMFYPLIYLPDEFCDEEGNSYSVLDEEEFKLITFNEYECG